MRVSRQSPIYAVLSKRLVLPTALSTRHSSSYTEKHTKVRGTSINAALVANNPRILALKARLQITEIPNSAVARALVDKTSTLPFVNNNGLSRFGKTLIEFQVLRHFMLKYPRLPAHILKYLVEQYSGMKTLAESAQLWGIQPDNRSSLGRYLSGDNDYEGLGFLSYTDKLQTVEQGITKIDTGYTLLTDALGGTVRAITAAVYAHRGLEGAQEFINAHVIEPRKIDITQIMAFSRPTRELAVLCSREKMQPAVSRLLAESGRYSSQAVFVVGVFSGQMKLGEGQGSSLTEARTRAAVNALQGWYLFSPKEGVHVDHGEVVI